ncbi:phospholipase A and acyltransferase 4-like [Haliotis asinina]|uniref:phospholipase A and acyltransferase 4-like n=1 Tax=Haliotis asinina TaxID=109174 RepID=UPI0035326253
MADAVVYRDSNQDDIQPGDLLKFQRDGFFHFAVYIGDGMVVHQTKDEGVLKQRLRDVIQQCSFYIDNSLDIDIRPKSIPQIVKDALSKVGRQGYNLFSSNCEHFATWCRNGTASCKQVGEKIKGGLMSVSNASSSSSSSTGSGDSAANIVCKGCTSLSKAKEQ